MAEIIVFQIAAVACHLETSLQTKPKKIVVAVPVASSTAAEKIRKEADELVALEVPPYFYAVGMHYESFSQITDQEVIKIMESSMLKH